MKKYRYWNQYHKEWIETDNKVTAMNNSYQYHRMYYKNINGEWMPQDIPDSIDLSNTDTFHTHELKGGRNV